jgi:hypothetical protein
MKTYVLAAGVFVLTILQAGAVPKSNPGTPSSVESCVNE